MAKTSNQLGQSVYIQERATLPTVYEGELLNVLGVTYFWDDVASIYKEVGSGGGAGGINYIENPDAEINTTGWATYADAAAVTPVDGTGGSANITWTRSTSSPLRGDANFLLTKDAVNRQGQGVSYDFTIDTADQAKVLRVSFDYKTSAAYADGDVRVYIYRTTATAKLIELSVRDLAANTVNGTYMSEFQADSDATGYRLILHVASTNASAYTIQAENFSVGPREISRGAVISDWVSFTPTGSWVSNVTYTGKWRRVGDQMEAQYNIAVTGTPTSAALTVNLPSGYSIDTTKLLPSSDQNVLGIGSSLITAIAYFFVQARYNTATTIKLMAPKADGTTVYTGSTNGEITQAYPNTYVNGSNVTFTVKFPIAGWSSSMNLSSDFGGRVVAMRATTSATSLLSGTPATAVFSVKDVDRTNSYNSSTGEWTCPESGEYNVAASISLSKTWQAGTYLILEVQVEGVAKLYGLQSYSATAVLTSVASTSGILVLTRGQVVRVRANQTATGTTALDSSPNSNFFCINKIQAPQTLVGSEKILCKYQNTAGTSITASTATVPFATKIYDSHNAFNGSVFTAPVDGEYRITTSIALNGVLITSGEYFDIYFLVTSTPEGLSSATQLANFMFGDGVNHSRMLTASRTYKLSQGNTLAVQADNSQTVGMSSAVGRNLIMIELVK